MLKEWGEDKKLGVHEMDTSVAAEVVAAGNPLAAVVSPTKKANAKPTGAKAKGKAKPKAKPKARLQGGPRKVVEQGSRRRRKSSERTTLTCAKKVILRCRGYAICQIYIYCNTERTTD